MNDEKLRFVSGKTILICVADAPDCYEATIHVIGEEVWLNRVCVYGVNEDDANGLRDRLLWALQQPTVPTLWQASYPGTAPDDQECWVNLDNGGEAARLKGEGYEIRALYQKQPLKED